MENLQSLYIHTPSISVVKTIRKKRYIDLFSISITVNAKAKQYIVKDTESMYVKCLSLPDHFLLRPIDSGDWKKETIYEKEFRKLLSEKIERVKMDFVKLTSPGL